MLGVRCWGAGGLMGADKHSSLGPNHRWRAADTGRRNQANHQLSCRLNV